ncbi:MAG: DUF1697 domain-containing protein [Verrucomicrobiota bacterium]
MTTIQTHAAFVRGINVGGRNKVPMKALRDVCEKIGCESVETLLQTGNVLFSGVASEKDLESVFEEAIESRFGFFASVTIRKVVDLVEIFETSPFADVAAIDPSRVILYFSKKPIRAEAQSELAKRAAGQEVIRTFNDGLWIYFPNGIGRSKLTPAVIDKASGSASTGRNWKTVKTLINRFE